MLNKFHDMATFVEIVHQFRMFTIHEQLKKVNKVKVKLYKFVKK